MDQLPSLVTNHRSDSKLRSEVSMGLEDRGARHSQGSFSVLHEAHPKLPQGSQLSSAQRSLRHLFPRGDYIADPWLKKGVHTD